MLKSDVYSNLLVVVQSKHSVVVAEEKNCLIVYSYLYLTYAEHTHRYPSLVGQKHQNP